MCVSPPNVHEGVIMPKSEPSMQERWDPLVEKNRPERKRFWITMTIIAAVALALALWTARPEDRIKTVRYDLPVEIQVTEVP